MGYQLQGIPQGNSPSKVPSLEERFERITQWRKDTQDAHEIARKRMAQRINKPLECFTEEQRVLLDTRKF
jgi:hypothetical protein